MAYTKQNFEDGQVLKAEHLNKMEQGIEDVGKIIVTEGTPDTLTWTAITGDEDIDSSLMVAGAYYPVSDAVVTMNDLSQGCVLTDLDSGETAPFASEECEDSGTGAVAIGILLIAVENDNATIQIGASSVVFPKAGVYAIVDLLPVNWTLTIPGYTGFGTEKLDPKYLPEHLQFGNQKVVILEEQTLTVEGDTMGFAPSAHIEEGVEIKVIFDGTSYQLVTSVLNGMVVFGNLSIVGEGGDTGEPFFGAYMSSANAGMLIVADVEAASHTVKIEGVAIEKLPTKYYDGTAVFYIRYADDSDVYLYTDLLCETKATKKDVFAVAGKFPIVLSAANQVFFTASSVSVSVDYKYAFVGIIGKTYYTAEYTA